MSRASLALLFRPEVRLPMREPAQHLAGEALGDGPGLGQGVRVELVDDRVCRFQRPLHPHDDEVDDGGFDDKLAIGEQLGQNLPQKRVVRLAELRHGHGPQTGDEVGQPQAERRRAKPAGDQQSAVRFPRRVDEMENGGLVDRAGMKVFDDNGRRCR